MVIHLFNNIFLSRYPRPRKDVFKNGYEFKWDLTTLIKDFDINPIYTAVNTPQANATTEQLHQVIYKILVTKDFDNKVLDYIYIWDETMSHIVWTIKKSYEKLLG